ncbi:META domain-containing protein [Algibacter sp. R77976]|uniref:META domain-containing protein n=1 Tax=Algibacter sp. R77976 TaxID=3093873 RepID=UPI0037CBE946
MVIDNTTYHVLNLDDGQTDDNGDQIIINFNESSSTFFDTYVCNTMEGQYDYDEINGRAFTIISTSTTLDTCNNLGNSDFENLYFSFFQPSTTYNFSIGCLLSGSSCQLALYSPNGDSAFFWNGELSTSKTIKSIFSIYPNPVVDELSFSSSQNLKN